MIQRGDTVWHPSNAYMHATVVTVVRNYAWIQYTSTRFKIVRVNELQKVEGV